MTVHLTGTGTALPEETVGGADIAERAGIPRDVVVEKMGIRRKHVCRNGDEQPSDLCVVAAEEALADADCDPESLDAVRYHGSEFKDYVVWSLAADVADRIGATDAYAAESYALCAGAPIAIRETKAQLAADAVDRVLLVAASREEDLVDYDDPDTSFTFNFGSGASAMVLERDAPDRALATVRESAALTDGSFSRDVVMPGGGTRHPPSHGTVDANMHSLRVPDHETMKERLGEVSLANFLEVADTALDRSGLDRTDLDFAAITHMKRSFHAYLCDELGLGEDEQYYLDDYGHVQSVDQALATAEARTRGWLDPGDTLVFLAAGTGYTWAATALEWRS
ncbi:3-oxoacyl-ACP synthase [Halosimplex pelagicum]|uniref:3-oxoacyl-ACP synthase n=1 Tax=Halosimplex pelagicum TaxID=869886 RepID=A0A7D5PFR0_9EURY|nr:3-oxoacyl-ACP synthase [Halosimplex pelagicum]QLH83620.1 3-oxoacyl-ACP synthase [Halosimplex pelagicum]